MGIFLTFEMFCEMESEVLMRLSDSEPLAEAVSCPQTGSGSESVCRPEVDGFEMGSPINGHGDEVHTLA